MKLVLTFFILVFVLNSTFAQKADTRYFELRVYYCHEGQLAPLLDRFDKKTIPIFERHGMENIGYWVPVSNEKNMLYYILAFPSKEAREKSWAAFDEDKEWLKIKGSSTAVMVDSSNSVFMNKLDLVPGIKSKGDKERVFELRIYTCLPGRLPNLIARFRDHTLKIFERHNMQNVAYFTSLEKNNAQSRLVYILAHPNVEEAAKSWTAFRADPEWIAARDASEKDGKIVEKVESVFLQSTSFSKIH